MRRSGLKALTSREISDDPVSVHYGMDIDILGASSDHIIIDAKRLDLSVGDEVTFDLNYGALLSSMTSPYVSKSYVNVVADQRY